MNKAWHSLEMSLNDVETRSSGFTFGNQFWQPTQNPRPYLCALLMYDFLTTSPCPITS